MRCIAAVMLVLLVGVAACPGPEADDARATRTERERDSLLGQSRVPGAGGVRGASAAADSAAARQRMLDSIAGNR